MPVPALAVKARPGSGRGCTNGGLASSAHGRRKTAVPVGRDRGLFFFYIVLRFAAMPVPGLAVKTRPGSGRGCTNGGFASSAPGGAKPPFLSDATGDYSFFIMFSGLPRGACGEHFK